MIFRSLKAVSLVLVLCVVLAGCMPVPATAPVVATAVAATSEPAPAVVAATATAPAATAVPQATVAPTAPTAEATALAAGTPAAAENPAAVALPAGCFVDGLPTFVDRARGLCFAYPEGFTVGKDGNGNTEVRGPATGNGPEPLAALLTIDSVPYQGVDLAPFVDEYIKANVPEGFPKIERKQALFGGGGAEVLEPFPGRLSSRTVIVDRSPEKYFILTFWPSFADMPAADLNAESKQAQAAMDRLYEVVSASFAGLPPQGVEIAAAARVDLPAGCLSVDHPLYVDRVNGYCFGFPPQLAFSHLAGGAALQGTAQDAEQRGAGERRDEPERGAGEWRRAAEGGHQLSGDPPELAAPAEQANLTVAGLPAVRLDTAPGRPASTEILMLRDDLLFHFRFTPPAGTQRGATAPGAGDDLIDAVTQSFGFLPAAAPAEANAAVQAEYAGVSFSYPPTLAQGSEGSTVPAVTGDGPAWGIAPEYREIVLTGYVLTPTLQTPAVRVYPVAEFTALSPAAEAEVAALGKLLAERPEQVTGQLPFLPPQNAMQQMHFGLRYVAFAGGSGIAYVTQYAQAPVALNNRDMFYTFQGLTADGKYYVSAIFPVSHPSLPASYLDLPAEQAEEIGTHWDTYIAKATADLASQDVTSFVPNLAELEGVVGSITILP